MHCARPFGILEYKWQSPQIGMYQTALENGSHLATHGNGLKKTLENLATISLKKIIKKKKKKKKALACCAYGGKGFDFQIPIVSTSPGLTAEWLYQQSSPTPWYMKVCLSVYSSSSQPIVGTTTRFCPSRIVAPHSGLSLGLKVQPQLQNPCFC